MLVVMPNRTYVDFLARDLPHRVDLPNTKGSQIDLKFMLNQRWDIIESRPVLSSLAVLAISMPKDALTLWTSLLAKSMDAGIEPLRLLNLVRFSRAADVFGIKKISLPRRSFKSLLVLAKMSQYYEHKMRPQMVEWWKRNTRQMLDCHSNETGQSLATVLIALLRQGDLLFVQEE